MEKQNSRNLTNALIARGMSAICYACACGGVAGMVLKANLVMMKVVCAILAIMMLMFAVATLMRMRELHQLRRAALMCEKYGEPVEADHGKTIPEVMANIRDAEVEYVAFFTKEDEKICESTINCPSMTMLSDRDKELILKHPEGTMVHNHPRNEPVAFSPEDLIFLATGVCRRSIVVTSSVAYVMESPNNICIPPKMVWRVGRKFYRGNSLAEASVNFCVAAAERFGWEFGVMLPLPSGLHELTEGGAFVMIYDAETNEVMARVCGGIEISNMANE